MQTSDKNKGKEAAAVKGKTLLIGSAMLALTGILSAAAWRIARKK